MQFSPANFDVATIDSTEHLEDLLSAPSEQVVDTLGRIEGDFLVLGVAGKMGPSLARMLRRALDTAGSRGRVIGVSRFSAGGCERQLRDWGIETIPCDVLDPAQLDKLPEVPNVISMIGMKFGSSGQEALTWAINTYLPGMICQKFRRSRIVAFSTGNIYGLTPVERGGSCETDSLAPVGDYAASCLGRERIYEHFSRTLDIPMALIRLNYAIDLRYGVLVDVARQVWGEQPIDVTMGYLNAIWQGDANAHALCTFQHLSSPPLVVNVTGPELLSVRSAAEEFGQLLRKPVTILGKESPDALLSNATKSHQQYGTPRVSSAQLSRWIAAWIARGGESLGKPTHFEVRDGKF